jgi:hypothetical protein
MACWPQLLSPGPKITILTPLSLISCIEDKAEHPVGTDEGLIDLIS